MTTNGNNSDDDTVSDDFGEFDATLSLEDPVKDYNKLFQDKMMTDLFVPDYMREEIWEKISAGARDAVWKLLFNEAKPTDEMLDKAATLLYTHKKHAVYYSPTEYNKWIVLVRDELLKRSMIDFWKNEIVSKELGPAWARDSDLYDDMDDPEPAAFYNYAGCVAAWLEK